MPCSANGGCNRPAAMEHSGTRKIVGILVFGGIANQGVMEEHVEKTREGFVKADADHDGRLEKNEFVAAAIENPVVNRYGAWTDEHCNHHRTDFIPLLLLRFRYFRSVEILFTKKADIFVSDEQHLERNEQGTLSVRVGGLLNRKWKDKMVAVREDELCVWDGFDAFSAGKVSGGLHVYACLPARPYPVSMLANHCTPVAAFTQEPEIKIPLSDQTTATVYPAENERASSLNADDSYVAAHEDSSPCMCLVCMCMIIRASKIQSR